MKSILNIELPLIQAPMNFISGPRLAAAVSNAGGMGVIGPNSGKDTYSTLSSRERRRRVFQDARALTTKPLGVNIVLPEADDDAGMAYAETTLEEAADAGLNAVFAVGGLHAKFFERVRALGMNLVVRPLTPTPQLAKNAEGMGAQLIIATGCDEGGWLPQNDMGTFTIVPIIVDAVKVPVIAAGGINDIRGVRAAFALGASGVYVGTRFIASEECDASPRTKELLISNGNAPIFRVSDEQHSLSTSFSQDVGRIYRTEGQGPASKLLDEKDAYYEGFVQGNFDNGIVCVNTGASLIKKVEPAASIVAELMADFLK